MQEQTDDNYDLYAKKASGFIESMQLEIDRFSNSVQESPVPYNLTEKVITYTQPESPMNTAFQLPQGIDLKVLSQIDTTVSDYFKAQAPMIDEAYKLRTPNQQDLAYLIVLKQDSIENRDAFFAFLDQYELSSVSRQHPVIFKFADKAIAKGFYTERKVEI